jgi:ribosome maturation factor RimP
MAQRGRSAAAGARAARSTAPAPGLRGPELAALRTQLRDLVGPVVTEEGLDLEELTVARVGRRYLVRVTVDGEGGVGHDELSAVSRRISNVFDEAEAGGQALTPEAYTLEVSSPGVDRALTLPQHWRRNIGRLVTVRAAGRTLTGRVTAVMEDTVSLDVEGGAREFPFADLGPGRVEVEFGRLQELREDEIGDLTEAARDDDTDAAHDDGDEELEDEA